MDYMMNIVRELQEYPSTTILDNMYCEPLKAKNLDIYLTTISKLNPEAVLVGDSPVYMGSHQTGIPFTDEYKIGNEELFLLQQKDQQGHSIINDTEDELKRDFSSAVIWNGLELELENMVLWNIMPFYTHEADFNVARKNLLPQEEEAGFHFLKQLLKEIPSIRMILVAGELASRIILRHVELKKDYEIYYISNPSIASVPEFISRVKKAFELKENILERERLASESEVAYEYRRRWADTDESGNFYCRALNKILPASMSKYCGCCPCNLYGELYCGYYDFNRNDHGWELRKVKRRFDLLIQANLIPLFPDYKLRTKHGSVLTEQAFQFLAEVYRDRISLKSNAPYLFYLMEIAFQYIPYLEKMENDHPEEIYVAILFHNILNNTKVASGRIGKEFGSYIQSLIDPEEEEHLENLAEVLTMFESVNTPKEQMRLFKKIFKIDILEI
ncbi:MAG: hypothetical protein Q4E73_04880 [Lachnospiraceae bacterium]|nr:hypothetical protein [Lachnospiraceae bacterium]